MTFQRLPREWACGNATNVIFLCLQRMLECGFQYENAGIRPPSPSFMGQLKMLV